MTQTAFTPIDLSKLPAPSAIDELSFDAILKEMSDKFKADNPDFAESLNFESEPISALNQAWAYRELMFRQYVNTAFKASLLAFSSGSNLDQLAALIPLIRLDGESDTDFRNRIQLAPEGFSTAGPVGGYIFHAKSASPDIVDIHIPPVTDATKGEVHLYVLAQLDADLNAVLSTVQTALNSEVRPLTDYVFVHAPEFVEFTLSGELEIGTGPSPDAVLSAARQSVSAYLKTRHKFGKNVTRPGLFSALFVEGVENVELISPETDIIVTETQVAKLTEMSVIENGGPS